MALVQQTAYQQYQYSRNPLIRTLVIRFDSYPGRFGLSGKSVENSI